LQYFEAKGAGHDEAAWAYRIDPVLRFLFPPSVPVPFGHRRPKPPLVLEREF
jgi:hypothetical protein